MKKHAQFLDEYLVFKDANTYIQEPQNLYAPIDYLLSLGGKQLRPLAVLLAHGLIKNPTPLSYELAHSVEVFHNFTLMHDDIMDHAPLRRGKTTVHEKWNNSTAILSGDLMLIKAYQHLLKSEVSLAVIRDFNTMAEQVCKGQQLDMDFEQTDDVSMGDYIQMIEWKTAVLLAFSIKAGAIQAGANQAEADLLYQYGIEIGIGFQLMDDYLDAFGDSFKVGKQKGGDILANKKTYLMLKAKELCVAGELDKLNSLSRETNPELKVESMLAFLKEKQVDQLCLAAIEERFVKAKRILSHIPLDTTILEEYVDLIQKREK